MDATLKQKAELIEKILLLAMDKLEELIEELSDPNRLKQELGGILDAIAYTDEKLNQMLDLYLEAARLKRERLGQSNLSSKRKRKR